MPKPVTEPAFRREALTVFVRGLKLGDQRIEVLADTVNYERISTRARDIAAEGHIELVEEYADRLARACLDDPRVRRVRVRDEQPEALAGAEAAGVETVLG